MASKLFAPGSVPSVRRSSVTETPTQGRIPLASGSSLKRSLGSTTSDLVTPAHKRRAYADPASSRAPSSAERIKAAQAERSTNGQLLALERQVVDLQGQLRDLRGELAERDRQVAKLEADRQVIAEREAEDRKARREAYQQLKEAHEDVGKELEEARQRADESVEAAVQADAKARREAHEADIARNQAASALAQLETLQTELERSDEELARTRESLEKAEQARDGLAAQNDELSMRLRDGATAGDDQAKLVREELHRQVSHLKTLEGANARLTRENAALKERSSDNAVLREKLATLDSRLKLTDKLHRDLAESQRECEVLQQMQQEWQVYLQTDDEATSQHWDSPRQVARALAAAQLQIAGLEERVEQLAGHVKERDELVEAFELRLDEAELEAQAQSSKVAEAETKGRRDGRMLEVVRREADMLREQLRTYALEETTMAGGGGRSDAIAGLDEVLDAYKKELHEARTEADSLRGQLEALTVSSERPGGEPEESQTTRWRREGKLGESLAEQLKVNETLRAELAEAQEEAAMLGKEVASLEATCDRLSAAVGRGEYDRTTTRVLQLIDNPAAQDLAVRTATLDALKAENAALLSRLSANGSSTSSTVPKETLDALRQEIGKLKEEAQTAQKKSERLAEATREANNRLRKHCITLLGWDIITQDDGKLRLRPPFPNVKDERLLFEPVEKGKKSSSSLQFVGLQGSSTPAQVEAVMNAREFWIDERNFIPGFLSSLTLEGYEAATRGGKHLGFVEG